MCGILERIRYLTVEKQQFASGRFNVVGRSPGRPKLLIAGHLDTVEPKQGWSVSQFDGVVKGDRLYGLGALDTKGGVASLLASLFDHRTANGLVVLFYSDEEYDFQGMRKFLRRSPDAVGHLAVVIERTDLGIRNAHRGLVELTVAVRGKSGHASNPTAGNNAIAGLSGMLRYLQGWLNRYKNDVLGASSLNVAFMRGGLEIGVEKGFIKLGQQGNNIADYAEAVLDIRTSDPRLDAEAIASRLRVLAQQRGLSVASLEVRHDLGALVTDRDKARAIEETVVEVLGECTYVDPRKRGHGDGEMIAPASLAFPLCTSVRRVRTLTHRTSG